MTDPISAERLAVTREEAISFLEGACRNWPHVPKLSEEDIGDVATELLRFVNSRRQSPAGVEPVGLFRHTGGTWKQVPDEWADHPNVQPLYASPPPKSTTVTDEMVERAVARFDEIEKGETEYSLQEGIRELLTAALSSEAHNG